MAQPHALAIRDTETSHSARAWADLLAEHNIPETTARAFAGPPLRATSIHGFAHGLKNEQSLEDYLRFLLLVGTGGPELVNAGREGWERGLTEHTFRFSQWQGACHALWVDCQDALKRDRRSKDSRAERPPTVSMGEEVPSWISGVGLPALPGEGTIPFLNDQSRDDLLKRFAIAWPGQALDEFTTPGSRLIDRFYHDCQPGRKRKWYHWRQVLSQQQEDLEREKLPRTAMECTDPEQRRKFLNYHMGLLENTGPNKTGADAVRKKFELRMRLHGIVLGAHQGTHMGFDNLMLKYFTGDAHGGRLGYRACTFEELMHGDKYIWNKIWELMNTGKWNLDEILLEFTVHPELVEKILSYRASDKPAQSSDLKRLSDDTPLSPKKKKRGGGGRGGGKGSGGEEHKPGKAPKAPGGKNPKAKGKGGKQNGKGAGFVKKRDDYPAQLALNVDNRQACQQYHIKNVGCKRGEKCKYSHQCTIKKKGGGLCKGLHPAHQCPLTAEERHQGFTY